MIAVKAEHPEREVRASVRRHPSQLRRALRALEISDEVVAARVVDPAPPHGIERPTTPIMPNVIPIGGHRGEEYPDKHPCTERGCEHTVLFDDEPWCYSHSPDSGS